jgi:hypothetical protein
MMGAQSFDAVIAAGLLERLPGEDVPWVLAEMFGRAGKSSMSSIAGCGLESACAILAGGAQIAAARRGIRTWSGVSMRSTAMGGRRVAYQSTCYATARRRASGAGGAARRRSLALLALADSLGWPTRSRSWRTTGLHNLPNWLRRHRVSLDRARSRRSPPARPDHRRRQAQRCRSALDRAQGGDAGALVHGRPWAPMAIRSGGSGAGTAAAAAELMSLAGPLHAITAERLADAAAA